MWGNQHLPISLDYEIAPPFIGRMLLESATIFHDASKNALCFECVWIVSVKLWMFRENTSMLKCVFQVCCLDCHRTSSTFPCPSWHLNGRVMVSSWWSYPSMASWACNLMHLPVLVNHPWSRKSCQVWKKFGFCFGLFRDGLHEVWQNLLVVVTLERLMAILLILSMDNILS